MQLSSKEPVMPKNSSSSVVVPPGYVRVPKAGDGPAAEAFWAVAAQLAMPLIRERNQRAKQEQRVRERDRERAILKRQLARAEAELAELRGAKVAPKRKAENRAT